MICKETKKIPAKEPFMSLDDITLSAVVLEKLYKASLVADSNAVAQKGAAPKKARPGTNATEPANERIRFLGNNGKNILLIVQEKDHAFLSDEDLAFLLNILNACHITLEDAALVNSFNDPALSSDSLAEQFRPATIIFFGMGPESLGYPLQIPLYRVQSYNDQQYLSAAALSAIAAAKELKKSLWLALKTIFAIP